MMIYLPSKISKIWSQTLFGGGPRYREDNHIVFKYKVSKKANFDLFNML